jgi:alkanesulfonate monooxygenase SsuD/methylene tetrahydromethanopterin reductase-like flavin-dependent oxidoreductase (luciferase family)
VNSWGTPERLIEQLRARRELIGDFELNLISYYGGMSVDEADASLTLFAREVLPEIQRW